MLTTFVRNFNCVMYSVALLMVVNLVHANDDENSEAVPDQYIVVFEDQDLYRVGPAIAATGESVLEAAERLLDEANQHQQTVDIQRGTYAASQSVTNELGHAYEYTIKGFSATLTADAHEFLNEKPEIAYIEPDIIIEMNAVQKKPHSWGLDRIDQRGNQLDQSYTYTIGRTMPHVYVIDSGIRATHIEYRGRVGRGVDIVNNDTIPEDCLGHGTHVSGTIAGRRHGVARNAILHPVKIFGCDPEAPTSTIIAAIDWVSANHLSPAVANLSINGGASRAMDASINALINMGVTTVVAAGNKRRSACSSSPARVRNAITVAASTKWARKAHFSNFGTCVDIFAPGTRIPSAWHTGDRALRYQQGTSMAAPHAAGAAAQFLSKWPDATPAQVKRSMIQGATRNRLIKPGPGSPNRLLYSRFRFSWWIFSNEETETPRPLN